MCQTATSHQKGFTLIELMITLFVLAIILGIAVPSFTDQIRNTRSLTFGEEFATALNYARSEAVKRGRPVTLCPSNDAQTDCDDDWTQGWLVVLDDSDPANNSVTVGEVLRIWDAHDDGLTLEVTRDGNDFDFARFVAAGNLASVGGDDDPIEATAKHEDCTGNAARVMRVGATGAINMRRIDC